MIERKERQQILKGYLGNFFSPLSQDDLEKFREQFPNIQNYFIKGGFKNTKKLGTYFLLEFGKKNYHYISTYDLVEAFFQRYEFILDGMSYQRYFSQFDILFIHHAKGTYKIANMENVIIQVISSRNLKGKHTIVFAEESLFDVETFIDNSFSFVINSTGKTIAKSNIIKPENIEEKSNIPSD